MEDDTPKTRAQARRAKKRKRSPSPETMKRKGNPIRQAADSLMPTQLQELHLPGMEDAQIWAQLELRGQLITNVVEALFEGVWDDPLKALDEDEDASEEGSEEDELSMEGMDIDTDGSLPDEDEDEESLDLPEEAAAEEDDDTSGDENMPEHITQLADSSNEDEELLLAGLDLDRPSRVKKGKQPHRTQPRNRHPTLDDDFFSIAHFNKEIEAAEAQSKSRGRLDEDSDEESIDLFQPVPEEELADQDAYAEGGCTYYCPSDCMGHVYSSFAALMYSDFFAPPPKTRRDEGKSQPGGSVPLRDSKVRFHDEVRVKMVKSHGNMTSLYDTGDDSDDEDTEGLDIFDQGEQEVADSFEEDDGVEEGGEESDEDEDEDSEDGSESEDQDEDAFEAMEHFKDDLFADEGPKETGKLFQCTYRDIDLHCSHADLSTFAQRQLALKEEIAQLERENIAKKDWTLMGEANSRARPLNSLLEEDLEFEHSQRVVPVITEERVKTLEEMIKARIIEVWFGLLAGTLVF